MRLHAIPSDFILTVKVWVSAIPSRHSHGQSLGVCDSAQSLGVCDSCAHGQSLGVCDSLRFLRAMPAIPPANVTGRSPLGQRRFSLAGGRLLAASIPSGQLFSGSPTRATRPTQPPFVAHHTWRRSTRTSPMTWTSNACVWRPSSSYASLRRMNCSTTCSSGSTTQYSGMVDLR